MKKSAFESKTILVLSFLYLAVFFLFSLSGQSVARDYVAHKLLGNSLEIKTSDGNVNINALHPSAFEVHYQPIGFQQIPSFAIDNAAFKRTNTNITLKVMESKTTLTLASNTLVAIINKSPFNVRYTKANGELIAQEEQGLFTNKLAITKASEVLSNIEQSTETTESKLRLGFRFKLTPDEKILGGGQRILGMDRRGNKMPLYNRAHYGYENHSNQMYYGLPAIMSSNKYMLVFDNSARGELDIAHDEADILQFSAVGGRTSYLIIVGETYPNLIENFVNVTGKQPMPPRWSLGNIASRFGYHSEQEARAVVQKYQEEDFPLDAIVFDLYWFGPDIKGHMGNLNWDNNAFPTPVKMIKDFKSQGINTIMITEPFVLTSSSQWQSAVNNKALIKNQQGEPETFDFYFGNTGLIDVFDSQAQDWFWTYYEKLAEQGVAGWWGDLGEPEVHPANGLHQLGSHSATGDEVHNAYGHQWAKMVYQRLRNLQPDTRPFVLMRSGFIGSQRYGMVPWTGDVNRSWGGFKPQVELALQMSLFGLSYIHSDLGGFAGDNPIDSELYIRWLQYGVFQPVYRPHAQENAKPEPVFHDAQTKDILRDYIKLRYQLMPYIYSLSIENSLTGMPIMRPMFFEDESNVNLIDEKDSYFYGDALLVTPVTQKGARSVEVDLPSGVWFNFWNQQRYLGNKKITIAAPLNQTPVLVRAGAFIPMVAPVKSTQDYNTEQLTLHYYADSSITSSVGRMYNDDGKDPSSIANNAYETLNFSAVNQDKNLTFTLAQTGHFSAMPTERKLQLVVHNYPSAPKKLQTNSQDLILVQQEKQFTQQSGLAFYDKETKTLQLNISWHQVANIKIAQ